MKTLGKVLNVIGQILAVLLVIALLIYYINVNYHIFASVPVAETVLNYVKEFGVFVLAGVIALSAILKTHFILAIILLLVLIAVAVFMFLPGALESFLPKTQEAAQALQNVLA